MMKNTKKIIALALIAALAVSPVSSSAKAGKKSVKITNPSKKKVTLKVGKTLKLKVKVKPSKAKKKLVFKSSKKKVARVNKKGKVKARKAGTAKISVWIKGSKKSKAVLKVKVVKKAKKSEDASSSAQPSQSPAASATASTAASTAASPAASAVASPGASIGPVQSPAATAMPSAVPSAEASVEPSAVPTEEATTEPTEEPTVLPTRDPDDPDQRLKDGSVRESVIQFQTADSSRIDITAGENDLEYALDDNGKDVLSKMNASKFLLGIGAHNLKPSYKLKALEICTANKSYQIKLNRGNVFGIGGTVVASREGISYQGNHNFYGGIAVCCDLSGVSSKDITDINFLVESEQDLELKILAGTEVEKLSEVTGKENRAYSIVS